jgi:hypothetical protein
MAQNQATQMISEMKKFAGFSAAEQRFICRSLDVAARGADGAAALPYLHPDRRRVLLASLTAEEAAAFGWSNSDPAFTPEWIDDVEIVVSQS